jgi:two-component system chemotaxis response regulator CheV
VATGGIFMQDINQSSQPDSTVLPFMIFSVFDTWFGINQKFVTEIRNSEDLTPMPGRVSEIEGIFMLRDAIFPVVNLANLWKMESNGVSPGELFLICKISGKNIAFRINNLELITRINPSDIKKNLTFADTELISGEVRVDDKTVILPDFEKIVEHLKHCLIY